MKILGIIVEYNPMHNGHIYQIERAKDIVKPDYTIVIMSGNFTEQGNISITNKLDKASLAVTYGVDLVIELPTIYATSSAEYFSKGAIGILTRLNSITHLAFGAECKELSKLIKIAEVLNNENLKIATLCKNHENKKINSAKIQAEVLENIFTKEELEILEKPNNILAIQYLKCIMNENSSITPVLIPRVGTNHNSTITNNNFASSTLIRKLFANEDLDNIKVVVPEAVYNKLKSIDRLYINRYWQLLKYEIIKLTPSKLKDIYEIGEGLENRIYNMALNSDSYEEFIKNISTKRYTQGRLKRICNNILLGITKEKNNSLKNVYYARILKISKESKKLLTILSENSSIPVITNAKSSKTEERNINSSIELDCLATKVHNLIFNENIPEFQDIITD